MFKSESFLSVSISSVEVSARSVSLLSSSWPPSRLDSSTASLSWKICVVSAGSDKVCPEFCEVNKLELMLNSSEYSTTFSSDLLPNILQDSRLSSLEYFQHN